MASPQAIFKFIKSLRPYISKGLISIEDVYIHLNKKGVEVTDIVRKAVNNAFKKQPAKDPVFDKTKIDLPIDDAGKPFNPNVYDSDDPVFTAGRSPFSQTTHRIKNLDRVIRKEKDLLNALEILKPKKKVNTFRPEQVYKQAVNTLKRKAFK